MPRTAKIRPDMGVVALDGRQVGVVTRVSRGDKLQVTQVRDGQAFDHLIPVSWVSAVDRYVFLDKGSAYIAAHWETVGSSTAWQRPKAA
jgi:hypothetical protein